LAKAISRLAVFNFQNHQETIIDPAPAGQLTVITGPSRSGKTAILRGLRWLFNNDAPSDFIRAGCSSSTVAATYEDGARVIRERGKSYNRYRIQSPSHTASQPDEQVYEGFGLAVPIEVQQITGVSVLEIGDMSLALNLSEQLDGPFLGKSISSGVRAKVLDHMAGTEAISWALSNPKGTSLASDLHRANESVKVLEREVAELDRQIEGYAYLPALERRIEALEAVLAAVDEADQRCSRLAALWMRLRDIQSRRAQANATISRWACLSIVEPLTQGLEALVARAGTIARQKAVLLGLNERKKVSLSVLHRWAHIDQAVAMLPTLSDNATKLQTMELLANRLASLQGQKRNALTVKHRWGDVNAAASKVASLDATMSLGVKLLDLRKRLVQIRDNRATQSRVIERASGLAGAAEKVDAAWAMTQKMNHFEALRLEIKGLTMDRTEKQARLKGAVAMLESAQQAYVDELSRLGICPVCGSEIDPGKVREVA
jgi:exonuclease SbcC